MLQSLGEHGTPPQLRLQKLIQTNRAIVAESSLEALLRRVVDSAREMVAARYAAIRVLDVDGTTEHFVYSGMDADTVATLGQPLKERGFFAPMLDHLESVRLQSIADDPRMSEVAQKHPSVASFLAVPIRSATSAYGNLYLANPADSAEFSEEDESLLKALAATASVAIENARLYAETSRRRQWLHASAEISRHLLAQHRDEPVLDDIIGAIRRLASADSIWLSARVPETGDTMELVVVNGMAAEDLRGFRYELKDSSAWRAMQTGRGMIVESVAEWLEENPFVRSVLPLTHAMAFSLQGAGKPRGAIVVCRVADVPFTAADLEMATNFTSQAMLAFELSDNRADRHKLSMLEDRARIAQGLQDHVVQKIFTAGLTIQGVAAATQDAAVQERLVTTIATLDDAIRAIRSSIFELDETATPGTSVRNQVSTILAELTPVLGFAPTLSFEGHLPTAFDEALTGEMAAVLRESLTNVAKHAAASAVSVQVILNAQRLCLIVADDGAGLGRSTRRSGLANLRRRAERRGGHMQLSESDEGGLLLRWTVPLAGPSTGTHWKGPSGAITEPVAEEGSR